MNTDLVPLPNRDDINTRLTSPPSDWMLAKFGAPGNLSSNCSPVTNASYERKIVTASVGPFKVTGHKTAVLSLSHVFDDVTAAGRGDLLSGLHTDGMLCVRAKHGTHRFSNHSWGMAVDMYFGTDVVPMGESVTQKGMMDLYPFFHARHWYWLGYSPVNDSMHFEASEELITEWESLGLL